MPESPRTVHPLQRSNQESVGVLSGSIALVAFGAVGFVDGMGSAALAHQFRDGLRHHVLADRIERVAHGVVIAGLVVVGRCAIASGVAELSRREKSEVSIDGTALAAVSLAVLIVLSQTKRRVASRVNTAALRSDGHLSAVGAAQAAVTLAGVVAASRGGWWADPAAAVVLAAELTSWSSVHGDASSRR